MIPYFEFHSFQLGPITIQVWGLFVALGILVAVFLMRRLSKKYFLSADVITDMALYALVGAFIGARFFHVVFYNAEYYVVNPWSVFKVWEGGLSSLGGFVGGAMAIYIFIKIRKLSRNEILAYADISSLGLWLGWGIGRIGCFLIHDHPGTLTSFVTGVKYPSYVDAKLGWVNSARHDLGLYESIVGFFLFTIFCLLFTKLIKKHWGLVAVFSWMLYAIIRFGLDFLRATDLPISDVRYWVLTPAQWGMGILFLGLTIALVYGIFWQDKIRGNNQKEIEK